MIASKTPLPGARRSRRVRPSAAFTLIELLTVIAIIGILAAIILPVVGKVRRTASSAQCASHMRQIGSALQLYTQDNRGHLPAPGPGGSNIDDFFTGQGPWYNREQQRLQNHIGRYMGTPAATTWSSSDFTLMSYDPNFAWPALLNDGKVGTASVVLNREVRVRGVSGVVSPFKRIATGVYLGRKIGDIEDPSQQIVFTEVDQQNTNAGWKTNCPPAPIHGAYRNALYFDGHVAKVPVNG